VFFVRARVKVQEGRLMAKPRLTAPSGQRDVGWLVAIGLCGAVVRLVFAWQYTRDPLGRYAWVDESNYRSWAESILHGGWWPLRPFYQDPLYPYWLACLMGVVGSDVVVLRLVSAGLGALTPMAVAWAGRVGLGRAEGLVAGWAAALYAPLIFADGSLEKEGFATFWTALALGLMAHLSRSERPVWAGTAGMAWGIVGLLRSNALMMAPLGAAWLMVRPAEPATSGRHRGWRLALAYLAGFLLVVMPVAAINTAMSNPRELLGTTWQLGPNFYIGNGPEADGTYVAPPFVRAHPAYEPGDYAAEAMRRAGRALTPGQVSRFWLVEGLKQWARAPIASVNLLLRKLALLTHRSEIPDNQDMEFVQLVAAPALGCGIIHFGIVFPLAAVGLARVPRTRFWWILSLSTGVGLAATALFFVVGRYRVPWVSGLILLASAGVVDLVRLARLRDWRAIAWRVGALVLPAVLLSWRPQADPAPNRWGNQLIALGVANLRDGRADAAIDALDLARASSPAMAANVRRLSSDGPLHELLRETIDHELAGAPAPADEAHRAILQARLLRQLPETSAQARSLLETGRRAHPVGPSVNREWAALVLSWPDRPDDRVRALEALKQAARSPEGDHRAARLVSVLTSDPRPLERPGGPIDPDSRRLARVVQAMRASRTPDTSGRSRASGAPSTR
jgi:hypothetical protein